MLIFQNRNQWRRGDDGSVGLLVVFIIFGRVDASAGLKLHSFLAHRASCVVDALEEVDGDVSDGGDGDEAEE